MCIRGRLGSSIEKITIYRSVNRVALRIDWSEFVQRPLRLGCPLVTRHHTLAAVHTDPSIPIRPLCNWCSTYFPSPQKISPHLLLLNPRVISLHNARFFILSFPQSPCVRPIESLLPQPHRSTQSTYFFGLARNAHLFISSNQAAFSGSREYCGAIAFPQHSKLSLTFSELSYGCPVALHVRTNLLHSRSTRDDRP